MNRTGALAGILVGGITVVTWKQLSGGIFDLYEIIPGFILSIIAIVLFSLVSREPAAEIVASYVRVKEKKDANNLSH